jgi:hypothetical protein
MSYPQQPGNWSDPSWPSQQVPSQQVPSQQTPGYPDPAAAPVSGQQASPAGYPTGYPAYTYPVVAGPTNNGMAVASMVISIVAAAGLACYGLGGYLGIVGAILGHVSRRQIRERGEAGAGMALAGIIVGWIATALAVLATIAWVVFLVWLAKQDPSTLN